MRRHLLLYVGVGLIITGLVGGLSGSWDGWPSSRWDWFGHMSPSNHMSWPGPESDTRGTGAPIAEALEIQITATEFAFSPGRLDIEVGKPVNLTFSNEGQLVHDLSIPGLDFYLRADPGEVITVSLTPDESGEFTVICTLPGHAEAGMVAQLAAGDS